MIKAIFAGAAALALIGCDKGSPIQKLDTSQYASPPETTTIVIKNYQPQAGNVFQNLFVSNDSVIVDQGQLLLSSTRDGMSDTQKQALTSTYGFTTTSPESVVTGFLDLVLYDLGITISQQSLMHCSSSQSLSTSNDALIYNDDRVAPSSTVFLGLRDCEKVYLQLNPSKFDNAGNGIPDYTKIRCGISPTNLDAAYISTAGDGVANIDKCKRHIPVAESAYTQPNQLYAYKYATQLNGDGTSDLTISNIPVLNHGAENFISFFVTETNLGSGTSSLYSAFAVLKTGYVNRTLQFNYWATDSSHLLNQQVNVP